MGKSSSDFDFNFNSNFEYESIVLLLPLYFLYITDLILSNRTPAQGSLESGAVCSVPLAGAAIYVTRGSLQVSLSRKKLTSHQLHLRILANGYCARFYSVVAFSDGFTGHSFLLPFHEISLTVTANEECLSESPP